MAFFSSVSSSITPIGISSRLACRVLRFSSFYTRNPSNAASRESPTPLVFVSSADWQKQSSLGLVPLSSALSEKGFTCLEIDLPPPAKSATTAEMMSRFEDELKQHIRLSSLIFPPIIFARSFGALIAQTYISSNPASGLVMIEPPASNAALLKSGHLTTELTEFDYEPRFPLAVVNTPDVMETFQRESRFQEDPDIDWLVVKALDSPDMTTQVEQWLDMVGV
jgi:pimeloyl-ACP methyl ester carboxylesterase